MPQETSHTAHTQTVRVYWEDTDGGGVVYHANYLRFFERARTEWLRALGFSQHQLREQGGTQFVVSDAHVRYLSPARLDDELSITVRVVHAGRASLTVEQQALRGAELLAQGRVRIGCVDATSLRPCRFPPDLLATLPNP